MSAGLVTFGLISFHLATQHLVSVAVVPVVYAAAMGAEALAALATGYLYDRHGARVLVVLPVLVATVPLLAFRGVVGVVVLGVVIWGAATGLQDSTAKALVADLVDRSRRASAYGVFAAIQGGAAVAGGAVAGALYERSLRRPRRRRRGHPGRRARASWLASLRAHRGVGAAVDAADRRGITPQPLHPMACIVAAVEPRSEVGESRARPAAPPSAAAASPPR